MMDTFPGRESEKQCNFFRLWGIFLEQNLLVHKRSLYLRFTAQSQRWWSYANDGILQLLYTVVCFRSGLPNGLAAYGYAAHRDCGSGNLGPKCTVQLDQQVSPETARRSAPYVRIGIINLCDQGPPQSPRTRAPTAISGTETGPSAMGIFRRRAAPRDCCGRRGIVVCETWGDVLWLFALEVKCTLHPFTFDWFNVIVLNHDSQYHDS